MHAIIQSKHKVVLFILGVILLLIGLYFLAQSNSNRSPAREIIQSGVRTLVGTTVCLPHKDTRGPQTLECAIGLETNEGYYSLDTQNLDPSQPFVDTGKSVRITGDVVPVELLSSIQKYDIVGVIRVQNIEEMRENNTTHTTKGGILRFSIPSSFALAVDEEQILVNSYIPPCDPNFDYCIYYNGDEYGNTNFDSAGVRLLERGDLTTQEACLYTPPDGYTLSPITGSSSTYATSLFEPLGDAGAGHYSEGALYRLFTTQNSQSVCYELETRIGESQYENYPEGEVENFNEEDKQAIQNKLQKVIDSVVLTTSQEPLTFPSSAL